MMPETKLDWTERWRAIYEARVAQMARTRGGGDFWGGCAASFAGRIGTPDPVLDLMLAKLRPDDRVLDVGAGSGRYAIPIAGRVREVVGIEPSAGMAARLREEAGTRSLANIDIVEQDWLSAQAPVADVVICAHVLYFTPEVEAFVRKLDAHASRLCLLVIRVDQMQAGLADLYQEIWGEPMQPEPSFIDLYNALYQIGIVADVAIARGPSGGPGRFESLDDAEAMAARMLNPPTDEARARIRPYLERRLQPLPQGGYGFPQGAPRVALLTWAKG